jgi:hypothetical protein
MDVRLSVRNHEQAAVLQSVANVDGESFRSPEGIATLA